MFTPFTLSKKIMRGIMGRGAATMASLFGMLFGGELKVWSRPWKVFSNQYVIQSVTEGQ